MRTRLHITFAATVILSGSSLAHATTVYDNAILSDGAYAYWPLQDTIGPTIVDVAGTNNGTILTSSDAPNAVNQDSHTTYTNAATGASDGLTYALGGPGFLYGVPGDTAMYFTNLNGQTVNSDVVVPYNRTMDVPSNFTAEAWVKLPTYPIGYTDNAYQGVFGLEDNSGTSDDGWVVLIQTDSSGTAARGTFEGFLAKSSRGGWSSLLPTNSYSPGWVHVALVYNVASFNVYEDGALVSTTANPGYSAEFKSTHLGPFVIGSYCANYFAGIQATGFQRNKFYHGGISHVAFYTNVLSQQQILNHYLIGVFGGTLPPSIGTEPVGGTNYVGYSRTLSVAAGGTQPLTYQWFTNGTAMTGATNSSLALTNMALANAGTYYVAISNALGYTNSIPVSVGVVPWPSDPYQSNIISEFPRAFYPLHETNGTVAADLIDPVDNNGVYVTYDTNNPVLLGQPGASSYLGTAVTLNPAATNGIEIANPNAMGIVGPLTLEAWVKVGDTFTEQWIIAHGPAIDANPNKQSDRLEIIDGYYGMERYTQSIAASPDYGAYSLIQDSPGAWVHLVGVADGTAWRLYENGVKVADMIDTNVPSGAVSANGGWAIGARNANGPTGVIPPSATGTTFSGSVNNVAIYDYALTPGTILSHYQLGLTGSTQPVVNTVGIAPDGSGNLNVTWTYGELQSAPSVTGPWTSLIGVSPYTVNPTNAATFFRATLN